MLNAHGPVTGKPMGLSSGQILSCLLDREAPDAPQRSQAAASPVSQGLVQPTRLGPSQPQTYLPSLQHASQGHAWGLVLQCPVVLEISRSVN